MDESTTACSSCGSEREPSPATNTHAHVHTESLTNMLQHQHHHHQTVFQDMSENPLYGYGTLSFLRSRMERRGSQPLLSSNQVNGSNSLPSNSPKRTCFTPSSPKRTFSTPNSAQGSCYSPKGSSSRTSSPKQGPMLTSPFPLWVCVSEGRRRFSDQELDHALCCDDDEQEEDDARRESSGGRSSRRSSRPLSRRSSRLSSANSSVFSSPASVRSLRVATYMRSCATQTAVDKSTQTAWPYVSPEPRRWSAERS